MLIAQRTHEKPSLDGRLAGPWGLADKSNGFVDMASGKPALLDTRAAVLWDDENLYIGFWVEEPFPNALQTERDSLVFRENDVEIFIDGGDCYYEFEINAAGTIYEVFFVWRDSIDRFTSNEFDVNQPTAYTFGGDYDRRPESFWKGTHPRGVRWAFTGWDMPDLIAKVHVDGVLNDDSKRSKGWTCEVCIPWKSLMPLANGRSLPPQSGDVWNLFLGRFQKIAIADHEVQAAWCVTPHGVYDTHMPERFTPVRFVD